MDADGDGFIEGDEGEMISRCVATRTHSLSGVVKELLRQQLARDPTEEEVHPSVGLMLCG